MTAPLRVGVLGLGVMGSVMAAAFSRSPRWRLAAVYDPDPRRVTEVIDLWSEPEVLVGERYLTDPAACELDVVAIATPPAHHAQPAIGALRAGAHVVCEKPLALTAAEGRRMVAAARASGLVAAVDLQQRYNPVRRRLRELLRDGYVGRPRFALLEIAAPELHERTWTWLSSRENGGGVLREYGSHAVDLVRWLFGEIGAARGATRVVDELRTDESGTERGVTAEDAAVIVLEAGDGVLVNIVLSNLARERGRRIEVHGDRGSLFLDDDARLVGHRRDGAHEVHEAPETEPSLMGWAGDTYTQPVARFLDDVAVAIADPDHVPEFATFEDAAAVMRVLDEVERSARRASAGGGA
ncbi:MAG: Gfo/Idh/MocA family oxidoreductase [Microbacteriaceae bacterium]|nr:Gfo/Idh/MocA family oxidoreductase [Microbacteriaceae bacterium]